MCRDALVSYVLVEYRVTEYHKYNFENGKTELAWITVDFYGVSLGPCNLYHIIFNGRNILCTL